MFHSIADFLSIWEYEAASTVSLFEKLTDESLQQKIGPDGRTLGRLCNHIVETLTEMPHKLGLPIEEEHPQYDTVAGIISAYRRLSDQLVNALKSSWVDADLERETNMYGENWKNGFSLFVLVSHQAHHRGQITVLMRQAGLQVIGVYGPTREEWEGMGMPAMA